ncbi:cation diffusion facilitator family transporter [Noviherbaspirillum massiliense]|uniref:cation diffusion facilitator family transporter n=1 Tax=Noviherbaspirillum massiliense TaxID=1465823 RepID=UPI00037E84A1
MKTSEQSSAIATADALLHKRRKITARSTILSALVNTLISAIQILVGLLASSQALVADGIHSLSDLVGDAVILLANHGSHKQPDEDHNYGHARYENAASLALGMILGVVGAGVLWSAMNKLQNPNAIPPVGRTALWAAVVIVAAKEGLFRYLLKAAKQTGSSMLIANAWHARSDAASSLIVLFGILGTRMGYPVLDPIAAMAVGILIVRMGWSVGWKALNDLMDHALPPEQVESIRLTLAETPGVLGVHELRTRLMGDHALVDAHLSVDPHISVSEGHYIAHLARSRVMQQHQVLDAQIHIDPLEQSTTDAEIRLPLRDELSAVLDPILQKEAGLQWSMFLHYLNNRLEIEIASDKPLSGAAWMHMQQAVQARFGQQVSLSPLALRERGMPRPAS